jgi:hypothetical protein
MADVFLSYAHRNKRRVAPIPDGLEHAGLSVWWDRRLKAGDDFARVIEHELGDARCVVVVWSQAARDSLWVRAEATEALDEGKLVPIRLDNVKPPLPFNILDTIDMSGWGGKHGEPPWRRLESRAQDLARGATETVDYAVFDGPPLQDMGSAAALGWLSIGLIFFTGALTLQLGSDRIGMDLYGALALASFAVACVCLALTLTRAVRTALASVRP